MINPNKLNSGEEPKQRRKVTRRKFSDKPKRPLSAYNLFLMDERRIILRIIKGEGNEEGDNYPNEQPIDVSKLNLERGTISFQEMGKLIGNRWKSINAERLKRYSDLASNESERYKREMKEYNEKQKELAKNAEASSRTAYSGTPVPPSSVYKYESESQLGYYGGYSDSSFAYNPTYGYYGGQYAANYAHDQYGTSEREDLGYRYPSQNAGQQAYGYSRHSSDSNSAGESYGHRYYSNVPENSVPGADSSPTSLEMYREYYHNGAVVPSSGAHRNGYYDGYYGGYALHRMYLLSFAKREVI